MARVARGSGIVPPQAVPVVSRRKSLCGLCGSCGSCGRCSRVSRVARVLSLFMEKPPDGRRARHSAVGVAERLDLGVLGCRPRVASRDWHADGARDGARRVWRGCGIDFEGRGRVIAGVGSG